MEEKFYNKALKFLSYRPRSEKEVRENLKKKPFGRGSGPSETATELIIKKLKDKKFIDDEEFAKWWVESRIRFRPRSIRLIKIELKQKGIDNEIIEKILSSGDIEILSIDAVKRLVEKRLERYSGLPKEKIYQKLVRFLAGKGFDWDSIKQMVDPAKGGVDETPKKRV